MILFQNQLKRDRFALQPVLGFCSNLFWKIMLQEDSKSFLKFGRESIAFEIQKTNRANLLKCSSAIAFSEPFGVLSNFGHFKNNYCQNKKIHSKRRMNLLYYAWDSIPCSYITIRQQLLLLPAHLF